MQRAETHIRTLKSDLGFVLRPVSLILFAAICRGMNQVKYYRYNTSGTLVVMDKMPSEEAFWPGLLRGVKEIILFAEQRIYLRTPILSIAGFSKSKW